ncbi:unnamed protein product [Calicophoron daubneyi]|uniref:Kinesin-like protein n=1 Tax=Calicophoron daubneyi TaxID=300641 RepID=A0AAV2TXG5_CALDB
MTAEAVKVVVRCRPLNERETNLDCKNVIDIVSETGQCTINHPTDKKSPPKNFFFDGSYGQNSTTEQIYNDIAYPLVEGVTEGYNGTIFAYGQTGCGKSYTMQGPPDVQEQRGIIPRAFDHVFETISVSQNTKFLVHASYLEIYNEDIRDLLGRDTKAKLELKEHPEKGVYVSGLTMHKVTSVEECSVIMGMGWKNRATAATLMNADSSRSHSIFTIYLEMVDHDPLLDADKLKAGKLNLVDLAGSERQSKTGASGDRFKEATKINLSLSALGNVISALVDPKVKHVPYRDSKLTRLLQDSLGGNTKTLMIACLSPADNNYDETLSTLRYANRAKNIQNKPKINEDPKDALLRQYQDEINRLKQMLEERQMPVFGTQAAALAQPINLQSINAEKDALKQEYEKRLRAKEAQYTAEAADKAKLMEEIQGLREFYNQRMSELDEKTGTLSSAIEEALAGASVMVVDPEGNLTNQVQDVKPLNKQPILLQEPSRVPAPRLSESKSPGRTELDNKKDNATREELLQRLKALQSGIVGGEQAWNPEARARRSRKQKYAEERRRCLEEANAALEDEGIMVGIYENIQDELRHKCKLLQREKQRTLSLRTEIGDIQSEFEQDRSDYLDTIRRQQRQIDLLQAIIDRIQPCVRRDSNYHNVDKIKRLARYDEEKNEWILPQFTVERTQLPAPTSDGLNSYRISNLGGAGENADLSSQFSSSRMTSLVRDLEKESEEEARFYAKLASRTQTQPNYFANRRASQLLIDAAALGSGSGRLNNNTSNMHCATFGLSNSATESNSILGPDGFGTLPGALDDMLSPSRRPPKLDSMTKGPKSPSFFGKQSSPSYRRPK